MLKSSLPLCLILLIVACASAAAAQADEPEWIWSSARPGERERVYLMHEFSLEAGESIAFSLLAVSADNHFIMWLNGGRLASGNTWEQPTSKEIAPGRFKSDQPNHIAIEAWNDGGPAAVAGMVMLKRADGTMRQVVTNGQWFAQTSEPAGWPNIDPNDTGWKPVHSFGKVSKPTGPWMNVFAERKATAADEVEVPEGFEVELLHSAQVGEGSWVSMTFDDRGRIIISPQQGALFRATIDNDTASIESLDTPVGGAQGLLYAFDSLYVNVTAGTRSGGGVYRLRDTDGDDNFDSVERLLAVGNGSEHGNHAIVLGPDGYLWIMHGNHTALPDEYSKNSPHRNWAEDTLLERLWDPNGHAVGVMAPGAYVLRMSPDGKTREVYAAGMRNPYDLAFNKDGELFAYDADMEWDVGTPWYRYPRVCHIVSAAEFGWRSGTAKWPAYYIDSLPAVLDTDFSSPVGMAFGTKSNWPTEWKETLFIGDWAYGRILAVHLEEAGSTYTGSYDSFVTGTPLPVTDFEFGPDGAMYFITGGRGTQSGLYRVRYTGPREDNRSIPAMKLIDPAVPELRTIRHELEAAHASPLAAVGVDRLWESMGFADRFIRYAARVALERRDVSEWRDRALQESKLSVALESLLALSRVGDDADRDAVLGRLAMLAPRATTEAQQLDLLRVMMVALARSTSVSSPTHAAAREAIDAWYPASSFDLDHELSQVLVYLDAPLFVPRTLALLRDAPSQEQQLHFALVLRLAKTDWTDDELAEFFGWIQHARTLPGGNSFRGFVDAIERDTRARLSDEQIAMIDRRLASTQADPMREAVEQLPFVRNWTLSDLQSSLGEAATGRSFEDGRRAFVMGRCIECHRMAGSGGSQAPDLTGAGKRFSRQDLLDAILEPSKNVTDLYQQVLITTTEFDMYPGRIVYRDDKKVIINIDPFDPSKREEIAAELIDDISPVPTSIMPLGLLNVLTKEQILDLIAYVETGGNPDAANWK